MIRVGVADRLYQRVWRQEIFHDENHCDRVLVRVIAFETGIATDAPTQ
jgi:hypothetical protein